MRILAIGNLFRSLSVRINEFCGRESEESIEKMVIHDNGAVAVITSITSILGFSPVLISKVPEYKKEHEYFTSLANFNIDISHVIWTKEKIENTMISIFDKHNERQCYTYTPNELMFADIADVDFYNYDIVFFSPLPYTIMKEVFTKCKSLKETFSVCMPSGLSLSYFLNYKFNLNSNYLFMNRGEITNLVRCSPDVRDIMRSLNKLELGNTVLVITMGTDGILVKDPIGGITKHSIEKIDNVKIPEGAGDAFATGYILSLLKGKNINDCCKNGHECAKLVMSHNTIFDMIKNHQKTLGILL